MVAEPLPAVWREPGPRDLQNRQQRSDEVGIVGGSCRELAERRRPRPDEVRRASRRLDQCGCYLTYRALARRYRGRREHARLDLSGKPGGGYRVAGGRRL